MGYADDLAILSRTEKGLKRMIQIVKIYERASNAKLSVPKSQLISFGKMILQEIEGIKQNQEGEKSYWETISNNTVRHLGVYVNIDGLINNIGDILKEVETNLNLFKFLYPNFCLKINLVKGYFFSKLNYISSFITINEEQIKHLL